MKKISLLILILALCFISYTVYAATAGPTITTSAVNGDTSPGVGTTNWTNVGNLTAADNVYATFSGITRTKYASTTGYGFSVPTGATITGIVVGVNRKASHDDPGNVGWINDGAIRLMKAGVPVGMDKRLPPSVHWNVTQGTYNYGASSDLWSTTWTPAEVNASTFGVAFSGLTSAQDGSPTGSVDYIQVTVYYEVLVNNSAQMQVQTSNTSIVNAKVTVI